MEKITAQRKRNQDKIFSLRLPSSMYDKLLRHAGECDISISEYMRGRIFSDPRLYPSGHGDVQSKNA